MTKIPDIVTMHIGDLAPIEVPITDDIREAIENLVARHGVPWEDALRAIMETGAREIHGSDFLRVIADGKIERGPR